ncbi:MAG TPA: disulfide bond formation protein B [Xanthobacteraceae bacterium]|nr:disulfide bond formation protein B [Xanthobacteraceae bacterium]
MAPPSLAFPSSGLPAPARTALLVAAIGAATLAGAWYFQLVVGLAPCPLCLEQRIPYYVGVPVALIAAFAAARGYPKLARLGLGVAAVLMAIGAGLALYHAGIEWQWWAGPTACSGSAPATGGNLLQGLKQARVVRCDEAAWRLFGISLAGWNVLIAGALALTALRGALYGSSSVSQ